MFPILTELEQPEERCTETGRQRVFRGVELDPLYVDVIMHRYEAATGEPVVLVETGETFEALAAHRALERST
jgi:hypothetical protein